VKNSITSLPVRHPHDAAQESGTYGGQGKAVRRQEAPTALLFEQAGRAIQAHQDQIRGQHDCCHA